MRLLEVLVAGVWFWSSSLGMTMPMSSAALAVSAFLSLAEAFLVLRLSGSGAMVCLRLTRLLVLWFLLVSLTKSSPQCESATMTDQILLASYDS